VGGAVDGAEELDPAAHEPRRRVVDEVAGLYHEAGHAVVIAALGWPLVEVAAGWTEAEVPVRAPVVNRLAATLAGGVAVRLYRDLHPAAARAPFRDDGDTRQAWDVAHRAALTAHGAARFLGLGEAKAVGLLRDPARWRAVDAVVLALVRHGRLPGEHAHAIINRTVSRAAGE
jgi:hypothetical protein